MHQFLLYEGKVAVVMAVFFLFFRVFLSRESLHRLNRVILICTVLASFILPFCIITVHKTMPALETASVTDAVHAYGMAPEVSVIPAGSVASGPDWWMIVAFVYFAGILVMIMKILADIVRLQRLISAGERHEEACGNTIIVLEDEISPFSWMHYIFLSREDYETCSHHVMEHERAHIRLGHAKELLCVELLSSMQWFNPAMWYLKSDLKAIYEYEADDAVLRNGADIKDYQYSLVRKALLRSGYSITNSFNHSILKDRITMMSRRKESALGWTRCFYVLPLLGVTLALNAKTVIEYAHDALMSGNLEEIYVMVFGEGNHQVAEPASVERRNEQDLLRTAETPVPFDELTTRPMFESGEDNSFSHWVNQRLKYPDDAWAAGIQGTVTARFKVNSDGNLSDIIILGESDRSLSKEVIRVLSKSPLWAPGEKEGTPVAATYTLPISFSIR